MSNLVTISASYCPKCGIFDFPQPSAEPGRHSPLFLNDPPNRIDGVNMTLVLKKGGTVLPLPRSHMISEIERCLQKSGSETGKTLTFEFNVKTMRPVGEYDVTDFVCLCIKSVKKAGANPETVTDMFFIKT